MKNKGKQERQISDMQGGFMFASDEEQKRPSHITQILVKSVFGTQITIR